MSGGRGAIDPIYKVLNRPILDKGAPRKPKFRKHDKVTNRVLYAILLVRDMKPIEFAAALGVTPASVQGWLYHGVNAQKEAKANASNLLGYPEEILFAHIDPDGVKISIPEEGKFMWRVIRNSPAKNEILAGLFAVHDLPMEKTCKHLGIFPTSMKRYIHTGRIPNEENMQKIEEFFKLPRDVLFAKDYFAEGKAHG